MSMAQLLELGSDFAGYRIEALIGRGGMGEVYKAEHPRLGSKVALKLLAPELAEEKLFRERFVRESRLAASLNHPNVIPIFDAGEEAGLPYIAMRYVAGPDLKSLVERDGPLPLERALSIVSQVGSALDCGHERSLIHRDVKPGNILLEESAEGGQAHVYLSDFGVAKHTLSRSGLTTTGQFVGTIDYIAPEQIEGKPLDGRADVYSLGCVLFEALTAVPPFERESNVAMMYAHLLEPPPSLSERRPELPAEFDEVIATALAKNPAERYPSCRALVEAVRERSSPTAAPATVAAPAAPTAAAAAPTAAAAPPTAAQTPAPAPVAASAPALGGGAPPAPPSFSPSGHDGPPSGPPSRGRRRLAVLAGIGLVAIAAGTAAGVTLLSGGDSGPGVVTNPDRPETTGEGSFTDPNPTTRGPDSGDGSTRPRTTQVPQPTSGQQTQPPTTRRSPPPPPAPPETRLTRPPPPPETRLTRPPAPPPSPDTRLDRPPAPPPPAPCDRIRCP
jgi:serine/threonine protein kinase